MNAKELGKVLNSIVDETVKLYEDGDLNHKALQSILLTCRKNTSWHDGNEREAMKALEEAGYCGVCLKYSTNLSSIYENDIYYPNCYAVFDKYNDTAVHFMVCDECKKKILEEYKKENLPADESPAN